MTRAAVAFVAHWMVAGVVLADWMVAVPAKVASALAVFVFSMLLCLGPPADAGLSVVAVHPHHLHGSVTTLVAGAADLHHQLAAFAFASFHLHLAAAAAVGHLRLFPFSFLDLPYSGNFHLVWLRDYVERHKLQKLSMFFVCLILFR